MPVPRIDKAVECPIPCNRLQPAAADAEPTILSATQRQSAEKGGDGLASLHEVARAAGVSISTVSRAISRPDMVNAETRERVEAAARELGYRPSRVARRLRVTHGLSDLVGLVIPDLQNPFFADLARGVEDVAARHGYTVLIGNSDENVEKEARYLNAMMAEAVDGIILPPSCEGRSAAVDLARAGVPLVCVDRRLDKARADTVVVDNVRGAAEATEHLIALGHRRIGYLEGKQGVSTTRERLEGYRTALADRGIESDPALIVAGDSRPESGRRLAAKLLEMPDRPTALLVGNGMMAIGALEAIHARGLRIPDDIAVVGYDDMPWALAVTPALTVVRQPGYELGSRAMELLRQRISEPERSITTVMLQPELVVRGSCGARPAADHE
jgi:DNA-binding LacI/PurR family transcriptional regulator